MRQFSLTWIFAAALVSGIVHAQTSEQALQESFLEGARFLQAGEYERAAGVFRELLKKTDSPRVKLELARALYHLGQYDEAKVLFEEVSGDRGTPWRVRDNIEHYIREIEARTGYWKMGVSLVSDSNPRNLTSQREFSIGGAQVTYSPSEQPRRLTGLRFTARGMIPVAEPFQAAAYLTASYVNYPKDDLDRLTLDFGLARSVTDSGRVRGKAGIESGTLAGTRLYSFPYIGVSSALAISETFRLDGELKAGRVEFPDHRFLDATYTSAALTARRPVSQAASLSLAGQIESSRARERPYSYYGLEISPGISTFWAESAFQVGATAALGYRKYADADPFFGQRRTDSKRRLEITVGNKQWRWMNRNAGLVLAVERGRSDIDFYSYKKANFSIVIE